MIELDFVTLMILRRQTSDPPREAIFRTSLVFLDSIAMQGPTDFLERETHLKKCDALCDG